MSLKAKHMSGHNSPSKFHQSNFWESIFLSVWKINIRIA